MGTSNGYNTTSARRCRPLVAVIVMSAFLHTLSGVADDRQTSKPAHPLVLALRHARSSLKTVEAAEDYAAEFIKRDIVNGEVCAHATVLKYRAKPMSAYLKFTEPHAGREVIYVRGKNDGKLLAHETGLASLVGTVALLPTSSRAMSESKHPITEIGMAKMLIGLIVQWEAELKFGEIDVQYYPQAKHKMLGDREHLVIQAVHPRRRQQFHFHRSRLWIDRETNLPVRVAHWGFPTRPGDDPPLLEEYTYRNVQLNVGLKDIDFDVKNPKYAY